MASRKQRRRSSRGARAPATQGLPDNPHDALFKRAFDDLETVRAELHAVLPPALLERLDLTVLEPEPTTFITPAMRAYYSDRLFRTRLAGREARVYVVFEHKSHGDRWALVQMLVYLALAYRKLTRKKPRPRCLPPIIPVLFTHAPSGWSGRLAFNELMDPVVEELPDLGRLVPRFEVLLEDLHRVSDAELGRRGLGSFATVAFALMRDGRTERLPATLAAFRGRLAELRRTNPDGFLLLLHYTHRVYDDPDAIAAALPEFEDEMTSIAEQLIEKGQRELLELQLADKFRVPRESVQERLQAADGRRLAELARRILAARTLADVFDE